MKTTSQMSTVLKAYLDCALWSSLDSDGDNYDRKTIYDFTPESIDSAEREISDFKQLCESEGLDLSGLDEEQIGRDFWLTRNRHGSGFWDRGLGKLGEQLTLVAHSYGSADVFELEDGSMIIE